MRGQMPEPGSPGFKSCLLHFLHVRSFGWACHFTSLSLSFPVCRMGVRISSRGVLAGTELGVLRSLECGEFVVGTRHALAVADAEWVRAVSGGGPGFLGPGTPILLACLSPRGYPAHPLALDMAKKIISPQPVGRNPKKQTPRSPGGDGAFPSRRGR